MRLTIRIHENSPAAQQSFAVLWLDTDARVWSREAHQGIDLPDWGTLESDGGTVALHPSDNGKLTLASLQGLSFAHLSPGHAGGTVMLGAQHAQGAWRLQQVDTTKVRPEHSDFPYVD